MFASDLLRLLEVKKLRAFRPFKSLTFYQVTKEKENIFLNPETTMHRGKFIGFKRVLHIVSIINKTGDGIFYTKQYFSNLPKIKINTYDNIFYKRRKLNG